MSIRKAATAVLPLALAVAAGTPAQMAAASPVQAAQAPVRVAAVSQTGVRQCLNAQVAPILRRYSQIGVSIYDYETGTSWSYRGSYRSNMASLTKLSTSVAVIMRAEDSRRALTATEKRNITAALRVSDNNAQTALWKSIGGHYGYDRYMRRLGLKNTTSTKGYGWGRTFSTPDDQARLMRLLQEGRILSKGNRTWLLGVMGTVSSSQVWGSSPAGKPRGTVVQVKNGWSPYADTNLWRLTSSGHIRNSRVNYNVAILSNGWRSTGHGIPVLNNIGRKVYNCMY